MRLLFGLLVLLGMALVILVLGLDNGEKTGSIRWNMPMAYADSNYQTQNAIWFAGSVKKCTGGGLDIIVHPGGSLFKGNEIKRAVQTGQVSIGERLLSSHANENALYAFDSIPFLATSFAESGKLWNTAREILIELMLEENMVLLYSVPWPPQGIYFKDAVTGNADMKRKKFRAYNSATARLAQLAGMVPVQIEAAELTQALSTGVVETFMASGSSGYDGKVWEHLSYFYDLQAWLPRSYIFTNKQAFNKLSTEYQNCLRSSARLAEVRGNERSREITRWYLEQLVNNGMNVVAPGQQLQSDLTEIGIEMTQEWARDAGPKGQLILDSFNKQ